MERGRGDGERDRMWSDGEEIEGEEIKRGRGEERERGRRGQA